ncbi:MAG: peptide chain release factor 2 [Deltaproteobacteria bacterium]|nr:peptide chain release factor 2 [Deltaproteobacteria bacterium]
MEKRASSAGFWEDQTEAQKVMKRKSLLESALSTFEKLKGLVFDSEILLNLAEEESSTETAMEAQSKASEALSAINDIEVKRMLGEENDRLNAIVSIHPGAGGTEAQDWADMLLRMYLRWAERRGYKTDIVDYLAGEEAGVKSVTLTVTGEYAYGYLRAEVGVHRLVRISPFDAAKRRHTSFASVFVYPEIEEDIKVEINDADLRVDTYRSSGAGGQHVNKTDSAVRITHSPTGIVVACQNERSQHKNRAMAMKILKARIYALRKREEEEKMSALHEKKDIAWGSQIRSYVLQPYRLVKDHRTGVEVGNVNEVLDGGIDGFIEAYLVKGA